MIYIEARLFVGLLYCLPCHASSLCKILETIFNSNKCNFDLNKSQLIIIESFTIHLLDLQSTC